LIENFRNVSLGISFVFRGDWGVSSLEEREVITW